MANDSNQKKESFFDQLIKFIGDSSFVNDLRINEKDIAEAVYVIEDIIDNPLKVRDLDVDGVIESIKKNNKISKNSIKKLSQALGNSKDIPLSLKDELFEASNNPNWVSQNDIFELTDLVNEVNGKNILNVISKATDIYGDFSYFYDQLKKSNSETVAIGKNEAEYQKKIGTYDALDFVWGKIPGLNMIPSPFGIVSSEISEQQAHYLDQRDTLVGQLSEKEHADILELQELLKQELDSITEERIRKREEEAEISLEIEDFERKEAKKTAEETIVTYDMIGNAFVNVQALMNNELTGTQLKIRDLYVEYQELIESIDVNAAEQTKKHFDQLRIQSEKEHINKQIAGDLENEEDRERYYPNTYEKNETDNVDKSSGSNSKKTDDISSSPGELKSLRDYFESHNAAVSWSKKDGVKINGKIIDTSNLKLVNGSYMATESQLYYISDKYDLLSAANGAVIDRNQLAMLHGSKNSPEFVINSPQMKKLMSQVTSDFEAKSLKGNNQISPNLTVQFNVDKVDANSLDDVRSFVDIFTEETIKQLKMGGVNIK